MFEHLGAVKWLAAGLLLALAVSLFIACIFGGLFFDLDVNEVRMWFLIVLVGVFGLIFVYALVAFIGWFLTTRPFLILILLGAVLAVFIATWLFIELPNCPIIGPLFG